MIQNNEEGLITAGGTSRGTWISWKKKWVDRNLSRGKCQVLHLGRNNPMYQYRLGTDHL